MPDTAPTTTQQSKPRAANPRVLQRTERLLEEGPAAVGVALKIIGVCTPLGEGTALTHALALGGGNKLRMGKAI